MASNSGYRNLLSTLVRSSMSFTAHAFRGTPISDGKPFCMGVVMVTYPSAACRSRTSADSCRQRRANRTACTPHESNLRQDLINDQTAAVEKQHLNTYRTRFLFNGRTPRSPALGKIYRDGATAWVIPEHSRDTVRAKNTRGDEHSVPGTEHGEETRVRKVAEEAVALVGAGGPLCVGSEVVVGGRDEIEVFLAIDHMVPHRRAPEICCKVEPHSLNVSYWPRDLVHNNTKIKYSA